MQQKKKKLCDSVCILVYIIICFAVHKWVFFVVFLFFAPGPTTW